LALLPIGPTTLVAAGENHHFLVSESLIVALEEAKNVHLAPSMATFDQQQTPSTPSSAQYHRNRFISESLSPYSSPASTPMSPPSRGLLGRAMSTGEDIRETVFQVSPTHSAADQQSPRLAGISSSGHGYASSVSSWDSHPAGGNHSFIAPTDFSFNELSSQQDWVAVGYPDMQDSHHVRSSSPGSVARGLLQSLADE